MLPPGFGGGGARRSAPGSGGGMLSGGRGVLLIMLLIVVLGAWFASGVYRVQPDERGAVLRFGAFVGYADPGLNYHLPWPIESVLLPPVTRINRIEIGYRSTGAELTGQPGREVPVGEVPQESLMLTGDENIIDIQVLRGVPCSASATAEPPICSTPATPTTALPCVKSAAEKA